MNIEILADVCEAIYYNGPVKSGGQKLDKDDFLQMCKIGHAMALRKKYYEEKNNDSQVVYFGDFVEPKEFKVNISGQYKYIELDENILVLPNASGLLDIRVKGEYIKTGEPKILRQQIGADWLYTGPDFEGAHFFIKKGKRIYFYNIRLTENDTVELYALFDRDDIDIADDIVFDALNYVMSITLKVVSFPIDPTDDNNPNTQLVKTRLADPAGL